MNRIRVKLADFDDLLDFGGSSGIGGRWPLAGFAPTCSTSSMC